MRSFENVIIKIHGNRGHEWLNQLPERIKTIANVWSLSELRPIENMSYNYVLSGLQGNRPIILKLAIDVDGLNREKRALQAFSACGAVRVINHEEGVLLLERAVPGSALRSYFPDRDVQAIQIASTLMKRLHKAAIKVEDSFPTIVDWLLVLDRDWNIPLDILKKARVLRDRLLNSLDISVLLHGDLHHDNILLDGDSWVAIDPKGVIGHPVNEIWSFLNNPTPILSRDIIENRINNFSQTLELDPKFIAEWCFVQSILSWIWDLEDNLRPNTCNLTSIIDEIIWSF